MGASVSPCLKVDVLFKKASSFILDRMILGSNSVFCVKICASGLKRI